MAEFKIEPVSVLEYSGLEMILNEFEAKEFEKVGFIKFKETDKYGNKIYSTIKKPT